MTTQEQELYETNQKLKSYWMQLLDLINGFTAELVIKNGDDAKLLWKVLGEYIHDLDVELKESANK